MLWILLPDMSHLSRGNAKSGCNMCRVGQPTGGKSSTPGRKELSRQKEAFSCPFTTVYIWMSPRGSLLPWCQDKSSTALIAEPPSEWKNTQFPLWDGIVALGVSKEITEAPLGLRATAECISHCCIVKRLVLLKLVAVKRMQKAAVSCIFHIVFHPTVNSKCVASEWAHGLLLTSSLISRFVLVSIPVIKVNLPATRALVRTRTTTEKNIFHSQRIHKPRQLHSTYTSNCTENRARLHSPPEPLPTLTPLLFLLFSL